MLNQVGTANTWIGISAGHTHSHAIATNTDIWSTGRGLEGELGIGSNTAFNTLQVVACPATPLSTNDIKLFKAAVYPNPTNGITTISYNLENDTTVTFRITTIQGQLIQENKMDKPSGLQTDNFDLSGLSNGIYFISINSTNGAYTVKLIKE